MAKSRQLFFKKVGFFLSLLILSSHADISGKSLGWSRFPKRVVKAVRTGQKKKPFLSLQRSRLLFLLSILIVAPALHFLSIPHSSSSCLCQSGASRNSSRGSVVSEVDSASSALSRLSQMEHSVTAHNNPSTIHPKICV